MSVQGSWIPLTYPTHVGVRLLWVDALILDDVLEGKVHVPAKTPVVPVLHRTVNEVLLTQRPQASASSKKLAFEASSLYTVVYAERYSINVSGVVYNDVCSLIRSLLSP